MSSTTEWKLKGRKVIDGVVYHCQVTDIIPNLDYNIAAQWKVQPTDVLIASYPKSGSTWVSCLVSQIVYETSGSQPAAFEDIPFVEMLSPKQCGYLDNFQNPRHPRVYKTHLNHKYFSDKVEKENLKVVVCLRNPKDILVSFYSMYGRKNMGYYPGSFSDFMEMAKKKEILFGDVFEWQLGWWEKRHMPNVFFVRYEDLKKDCAKIVSELSSFLQQPVDKGTIEKIAKNAGIENMRETFFPSTDGKSHFRKGQVGDWINYFSPEESEFVDSKIQELYEPNELFLEDRITDLQTE